MNPLVRRLAHEASAPVEEMIARLIRTAALVALGAGCAIAASVFLTVDLYLYVESRTDPLIAAASVAGLYLCGAIVFFALALSRKAPPLPDAAPAQPVMPQPARQSFAAASVGAEAAAPAPARHPLFAANIDAAVAPVVSVMRDAGLEREVIAVEAGVEVAKQLNPLSLVAFAMGAGVVLGRTLRTRRTL